MTPYREIKEGETLLKLNDVHMHFGKVAALASVVCGFCACEDAHLACQFSKPKRQALAQAIKAVVVPVPGSSLTERDVIGHCTRRLESFMVPKFVEFREDLPKTSTGKIKRAALDDPDGS